MKPGLFPTSNQIQSSAYPRDLLDSVLALPKFAVQCCAFFRSGERLKKNNNRTPRKDVEMLKLQPHNIVGWEVETGSAALRSSLLHTACLGLSLSHFLSNDLPQHWPSFQPMILEARTVAGQHSSTVSLLRETTDLSKTSEEPKLCLVSPQPQTFGMVCSRTG